MGLKMKVRGSSTVHASEISDPKPIGLQCVRLKDAKQQKSATRQNKSIAVRSIS